MSSIPSPVAAIIAQRLVVAAQVLQATIFLAVASLIVMVFDTIITIDQEYKFAWRQKWSFGKAMFLFMRHGSTLFMLGHVISMLLNNPSAQLCRGIETAFVWLQVILTIAGSSVLIVRTWLLCGGEKWILAGLISGLVGVTVPSVYFVVIDAGVFVLSPNPAPALLPGCLVRISPNVWRPFVFPLVYETFILGITIFKASTTRSRTPMLMRLFRDGTLYYCAVVAALLATTIGATDARLRPIFVGSGYHIAFISIGCSRLFLSLHSWSEERNRSRRFAIDPSTRHSSALHRKDSHTQPSVSDDYELTVRTNSDIESANGYMHARTSSGDTIPPSVPPKDTELRSVLPNIERPSLPERMWSTLPGVHTRQSYQRPPRSSSLYASGRAPEKLPLRPPTDSIMKEEPEEPQWRASQTSVSLLNQEQTTDKQTAPKRKYNVI